MPVISESIPRVSESVLLVMQKIWDKSKNRLSNEDIEDFVTSLDDPYNLWAEEELRARRLANSKN